DPPPRLAAGVVRRAGTHEPPAVDDPRVPPAVERLEVRIAEPHEARALELDALAAQLVAKAGDHARLIGEPLSTRARQLVLAPQPIRGREQERVDVLGHVEVRLRAGELVDVAPRAERGRVD